MTLFELIPLLVLLTPAGWHGYQMLGVIGIPMTMLGWLVLVLASVACSARAKPEKAGKVLGAAVLFALILVPVGCFFAPVIVRSAVILGGSGVGWMIVVVVGVFGIVESRRLEARLARGQCAACGYSLQGIERGAACPECGRPKQ